MGIKKKILFLEDEKELLDTVSMLLRDQGYQVIDADKGEDALALAGQNPPDLILADIKLPGIDGFDFLKSVRELEGCEKIPFVFLTAFNDMKAMMNAKRQGASEYITKPFDVEYLVTRIRELVPP